MAGASLVYNEKEISTLVQGLTVVFLFCAHHTTAQAIYLPFTVLANLVSVILKCKKHVIKMFKGCRDGSAKN